MKPTYDSTIRRCQLYFEAYIENQTLMSLAYSQQAKMGAKTKKIKEQAKKKTTKEWMVNIK